MLTTRRVLSRGASLFQVNKGVRWSSNKVFKDAKEALEGIGKRRHLAWIFF